MEKINWYRTDLIDESEEVVVHRTKAQKQILQESEGVAYEESEEGRLQITHVQVDATGEQKINKKAGNYITLSAPSMHVEEQALIELMKKHLLEQLQKLHEKIKLTSESKILVVGLGNKTITPDAIGPYTIDAMMKMQEDSPFIMYAPGVTGQTGFETKDFIAALTEKIKPALVIVIDALATRGTSRLCRTIQLTDTGIHPGSGVGNMRAEISQETLGVPVTAIGVPTVVQGSVLIADAIEKMFRSIAAKIERKDRPSNRLAVTSWQPADHEQVNFQPLRPIFGEWTTWSPEDRHQLLQEVFASEHQLIVTPKEIDLWLRQYADLLSETLFDWSNTF